MNTKANECWASDASAKMLRIELGAGKAVLLKLDHLIDAEFDSFGVDQSLRLHFAAHEVVIRGTTLRRIEAAVQRLELSYLATVPPNCLASMPDGQPVVREIIVTEVKDGEDESNAKS